MNTSIGQWGNSLAVRLPKHIVQALNLKVNDRLTITEKAGKIVLELIPELPELSLDDLLSQVTEEPEPEIDWGKPEGEVSQGKGKLMLFLHGFPEFWYSWRHQIAEFAHDYHVVALDLRGYNASDKPQAVKTYEISELLADVKGVISNLGYQDCILVAHDWGGAIAWSFAYQYPQMVEKLIVMNIPHPAKFIAGLKTWQQLRKSWYIFFFQIPYLPEFLFRVNNYQAIASAFRDMAINKSTFTPEDLTAYRDAAAKPGALTAMINYYRANFKFFSSQTPAWGILDIPTLMIWAEEDVALGKELTYGTEAYVKNLQLKYIPNCSHWVQQEKPTLVNQYMQEFLANSYY